jgi:sec-independent protein translocase protein TatA
MLPNVGWPELLLVFAIVLLLFGPQRLAGVGAALGKAMREFRRGLTESAKEDAEEDTDTRHSGGRS